MKIAIFTDTFLPSINGIVTSVVNASKKLAQRGHKILILTSQPKSGKKISLGDNIIIKYFKQMNVFNYPDFGLTVPDPRVFYHIKKFKPDIIHSHLPTPLGWWAVIISRMMGIPLVGTYHTLLPDFLEHLPLPKKFNKSQFAKKLAWNYTRRYYNRCDIVTTPSLAMKRLLKKQGIRRPVKAISNGVDLNRFHPKKFKKNRRTVLYVGRVSYEKNIDVIIKAFKIVLKELPDVRLIIVGRGPGLNKLKKVAGKLLNKSIIFKGPILHKELANVYSEADLFATASTIETEGLVILEAMASGLPIVGVNALAVPDIVKHQKNGLIAKPGNVKEIADDIKLLLQDKKLAEEMGQKSLEIVKKFSLDLVINNLEMVYCSLTHR